MFDIPMREVSAAQLKRERQDKERWQRCLQQARQEIRQDRHWSREETRRRATDLFKQTIV